MASKVTLAEARRHAMACNTLAAVSQNNEIKAVAAALSDANKWLDANFTDIQYALRRLAVVEAQLTEAVEEIQKLKSLVRQ